MTVAGMKTLQSHKHKSNQGTKRESWCKKNKKCLAGHKKIDLIMEYPVNRRNAKPNGSKPRKHTHLKKETLHKSI